MAQIDDHIVMRRAGRYLLDHITVARFGFDLIDALIMVTVSHANVALISRDPELQRRYATYDCPPPDDLRRPISVNAVAQSLGLPFETVRRRIAKMSLLGIFKTTSHGVYVPTRFVVGKQHKAALQSGYQRIQSLQADCGSACWDEPPRGAPWRGAEPLRLVARISSDYLLRFVHLLMEEAGDPASAAVWLALFCNNFAVADRGVSGDTPACVPISMSGLARYLRLSTETTRRRVHELIDAGLCVEHGPSIVVDESVMARPGVQRLLARGRQDLRRMFGALADYGVPQSWMSADALAAAA